MFEGLKKRQAKGISIIVIGCGKVGHTLTEQLVNEGYDITVIDKSAERVNALTDLYDVMGIVGNGASFSVLSEAGIEQADLLIAVTDMDELNLLCCTVAKRVGHCAAIARVRAPEYSEEVAYLREKLGLAMIINPDLEAANEISRILNLPDALSVNPFAGGKVEMIRFKVAEGSALAGQNLAAIGRSIDADILICAVERDHEVYIPDGHFALAAGDVVSVISTVWGARDFFKKIGLLKHPVRNAMLIGGSRAAYYLAKGLIENGVKVKIIEKDRANCERLSDLLPEANIINGDGTDAELLAEEEIGSAEAVVPLTGLDEENILLTLHAADVSDAKVVTKIKRNTFHNVIDKLNLGSIVYPKYITAEVIVAYVRGLTASIDDDNIETLYHMFDNRVEAVEFKVREKSDLTGRPLKDLKLRDNLLIACITRGGEALIPGSMDTIEPGDSVIIVTTHTGMKKLKEILR